VVFPKLSIFFGEIIDFIIFQTLLVSDNSMAEKKGKMEHFQAKEQGELFV